MFSWFEIGFSMLVAVQSACGLLCSRYPANTFTPKSPVDDNFAISVTGNPQTYTLGQKYNISINAFNGLRFVSFTLALENDNGDASYNGELGHFEITDAVETRYSPNCINMVENTNTNPKTHVDVSWVAPSEPGGGCVLLRATVLQHRDVWYMDDGGLTRRICEEIVDDVESQRIASTEQAPCCACDEARYNLIFDGLWSRNLHPKDFPTKGWITRFSDIVGASHKADYRFWEYGTFATMGTKELAEHGSSRLLEREFSTYFKSGDIRTIIKARGPAFPNVNGRSVASVRVDAQHHLISLASKIEPSPDWIVGVSGLELCLPNCTWLENKVIYLYPWDVGTDAGPTYTSPTQPQVPADVIRRIRSDFPNDPRSPFYDESGAPMKPMATLTVKRQRIYERLCEDEDSNNVDVPRGCVTHPWSVWTLCSVKCGEGRQFRSRVYKQPEVASIYNCDMLLVKQQNRSCYGNDCGASQQLYNARPGFPNAEFIDEPLLNIGNRPIVQAECALSDWDTWSTCNSTCGEGMRVRRRQYINPMSEDQCQRSGYVNLYEYESCTGYSCLGEVYETSNKDWHTDTAPVYEESNGNWNAEGNNNAYDAVAPQEYNPYVTLNGDTRNSDGYFANYENNFKERNLSEPPSGNQILEANIRQNSYNSAQQFSHQRQLQPQQQQQGQHHQLQQHNYNYLPHTTNDRSLQYAPSNYPSPANREGQRDLEMLAPAYCFQPLHIFTCLDVRVTGNFWFYNYCRDECMLYASDSCDRNENKFTSLEMCEMRCRQPALVGGFLRRKQLQDCHNSTRPRQRRQRKHNRRTS